MNTRILIPAMTMTVLVVCQQIHAQDEDKPEQAETTELEGTWAVVSYVIMGERSEPEDNFLRFVGNKAYWIAPLVSDGQHGYPFSVKSSAMPPEIELFSMAGIYELDGDSLRFCIGFRRQVQPEERASRFESSEEYPADLWALRRVAEEEEE